MSVEIMLLALFAVALLLETLLKNVGRVLQLGLNLAADNQASMGLWPASGAGIVMMALPLLG